MITTGTGSIFVRLKLWVIAVLLAVLGLAMVAEFTTDVSYSDDITRVRLMEMEEHASDNDASLHLTPLDFMPASALPLLPTCLFVTIAMRARCRFRTTLVHSLRLRGPPPSTL